MASSSDGNHPQLVTDRWNTLDQSEVQVAESDVLMLVLGMTGAGKSTFISLVTNKDGNRAGSTGVGSGTAEVGYYSGALPGGGGRLVLIDTPGFGSVDRSDTEILAEVAAHLAGLHESGVQLSGIIYLHAIDQPRMHGAAVGNIRMLSALCGIAALSNLALVPTKGSQGLENGLAEKSQKMLEALKRRYWNGLIEHGAVVLPHSGTCDSANDIVDHLSGRKRKPLAIQVQVVDDGLEWNRTDAARALLRDGETGRGPQARPVETPDETRHRAAGPRHVDRRQVCPGLSRLASVAAGLGVVIGAFVILSFTELGSRGWKRGRNRGAP